MTDHEPVGASRSARPEETTKRKGKRRRKGHDWNKRTWSNAALAKLGLVWLIVLAPLFLMFILAALSG